MKISRWLWLTAVLSLGMSLATAQNSCPELVQQALAATDTYCAETERNTACYGSNQIIAQLTGAAAFAAQGDVVPLSEVASLTLAGLDEQAGVWGVSLLRVQADIPETLPGQAVTFLLFGDVTIENAADAAAGETPMQAFYFKSGVGAADCAAAPDGILVQTPAGVAEINLTVNGAEVSLGSTAFFQTRLNDADKPPSLTMSVLEGQGSIAAFGVRQPVFAGSWVRVPIDADFNVAAAPGTPKPYQFDQEDLGILPVNHLERLFAITPSLSADRIATLLTQRPTETDPAQYPQTFINDLDDPVTLTLPGQEPLLLAGGDAVDVALNAGLYRATICTAAQCITRAYRVTAAAAITIDAALFSQ